LILKNTLTFVIHRETMARILFVDDDFFTLETYEKLLSFFGHQSILANTCTHALQLAVDQSPDLIILDMRMPDMDGFEFLKELRSNPDTADIPAAMVSASPDVYAKRAKAAGAQYYLAKPIRTEKLLEIIAENTTAE